MQSLRFRREQSKKGIVNDSMIPDYVVLDSNMIRKLPKSIVAATGVDALAHVVECFTSKKATPFSDTYAAAGAKLIFHNIREAYNNPDNMEAKSNMMTGAFLWRSRNYRKRNNSSSCAFISTGRQISHCSRCIKCHTFCTCYGI